MENPDFGYVNFTLANPDPRRDIASQIKECLKVVDSGGYIDITVHTDNHGAPVTRITYYGKTSATNY